MNIKFETPVEQNFLGLKEKFGRALFEYLKPPGAQVEIERFDGCSEGDEIHLDIKLLGKKRKWVSLITNEETTPQYWSFTDEGKVLPWPMASWKHVHKVEKINENESRIVDDIHFECRPHSLTPFLAPALWLSFAIRPYRYQQFFRNSHA